jgi:uncharacterized membrane protein YheB (UPF0754 family)
MSWLLFPLVGAVIGWLIMWAWSRLIPGIIFRRKTLLAASLSRKISQEIFSQKELEEKLSSYENFQKILPSVEAHIDDFLRHKLGKSMPMLSMFVGDKTIQQLKGLFMEELALIFPEVMKKYIGQLQQETSLNDVLHAKLTAIPYERFSSGINELFANEMRLMKMMGASIGFFTGLVLVLLAWVIGMLPFIK